MKKIYRFLLKMKKKLSNVGQKKKINNLERISLCFKPITLTTRIINQLKIIRKNLKRKLKTSKI